MSSVIWTCCGALGCLDLRGRLRDLRFGDGTSIDVSRLLSRESSEETVGKVHDVSVDSSDLLVVDARRLLLLFCLGDCLELRRVFLLGLVGVLGAAN